MCFGIRYNEIFSHHIFSKANIPCVFRGHQATQAQRVSRDQKDLADWWWVGNERQSGIFACWWWNVIRASSDIPSYSLTSHLSPGCRRSVGTHRHHRPQRSSCMYLLSCAERYAHSAVRQRWSNCLSIFSPSGIPGWQRKSGGDGAWRHFW